MALHSGALRPFGFIGKARGGPSLVWCREWLSSPRCQRAEAMRTSSCSSLGGGERFERGVCTVRRGFEVASIKRDQRARDFQDRVHLI